MTTYEKTLAQRELDEGHSIHNDQKDHSMTDETSNANLNDIPACPSWCTYTPGHDYDTVTFDGEDLIRFHGGRQHIAELDDFDEPQPNGTQSRTPIVVEITCIEINTGGTVTLGSPVIDLGDEINGLTAHDCLRLIHALDAAIGDMEKITGERVG